MKHIVLAFTLAIALNISKAQNLVPNPGFELFSECPSGYAQFNKTKHWFSGNTGTPEYFRNECDYSFTNPYSGKAYAGLIISGDYPKAIEYLMVELTDTLEKDSTYCLSFFVQADESFMYTDQIGMHLSRENLKLREWAPIHLSASLTSNYGEPIVPQLGWLEVKGDYKARGGEQFLSIGNFLHPDKHIYHVDEFVKRERGWNSYYFIDNVTVQQRKSGSSCQDSYKVDVIQPEVKTKELEIVHVVYFNSDSYKIQGKELEKLKTFLTDVKVDQIKSIEFHGHTDSKGSTAYNNQLSRNRCNAVYAQMKELHISDQKVNFDYFGELVPTESNDSHSGRAANRRVEIKLIYLDREGE